ncbi:Brp/Blh family beta-carotene 15,15'-monooxygenase [Rhodovulum sp. 12E13]|uniref:Brp/Blh family beta-carotene 15,15'-dioxygenase n=1 Tax=Rhodovulum sp. 12E13 TaxID=2203891 RepID=UPI000E1ABAFA|nr:Brp/Blh family beta-carotene 15,15'-dioxygenase [Rhodovulum sp. 12E13]RDC71024.1 Brp/Blh family beta-carotene 15,15'-monooxygenase [Rhodovulum sp. 12E13]
MTRARAAQTGIFLAGLALVAALDRALAPGLLGQALILAPAVAVLGLPHGALDLPMAEALWPLSTRADRARFFAAYLGLAAGVALLWWLAPGPALVAFLAYSALHFAGDWEGDGHLAQAAGGVSAIGAPALTHTDEVTAIFALLAPDAADAIAQALAACGVSGGILVLSCLATADRRRLSTVTEHVGIWIGAALLPPLLYFVAYFCLLHSVRHFMQTLAALPDRPGALQKAGTMTAVTLTGAAAAYVALFDADGAAADAAILQTLFIGLAALTVPHMLLVERFRKTGPRIPAEAE